jgi:hypothetical protein
MSVLSDPFSPQNRLVDGRQSEAARLVQRGVGRLLVGLGFSIVYELPLASGRRADVAALSAAGDLWIVEIKSSVEDFRADHKWTDYRLHCDRLFFATHAAVPMEIFPGDTGLMMADGYGAAVVRDAPEMRLPAATRKAMTLRFAHAAARRFHAMLDPGMTDGVRF